MRRPVELITRWSAGGRRWGSVPEKLRLLAATREPGLSVAAVARQHGLSEGFALRRAEAD
jgi:transposase-like protein